MTNEFKGVSFFSCGGLMDFGARDSGITIAYANEIDAKMAAYHAVNFLDDAGNPIVRVKPIQEVTTDEIQTVLQNRYGSTEVDAVFAGPPCLDFTILNKNKRTGANSRNWLVLEFLKKLEQLNSKVAVMEEVPSFLTDKFYFPLFKEAVSRMNYVVKYKVLCAHNYEGNSIRERAIFIFVRKDLGIFPVFPKEVPEGRKVCKDFLDIDAYTSGHFDDRLRLSNEPMTTVTSGSPHLFFKDGKARKPTEREIMLCQSLDPDRYILPPSHTYSVFRKVMGNGVPSKMAYHIFKTIIDEILSPSI